MATNPLKPSQKASTRKNEIKKIRRFTHQKTETPGVHQCTGRRILEKAGYSKRKFEDISLQAFHSPSIRKTMTTWEANKSNHFKTSEATLEAKVVTTTKKVVLIITITFFPKNIIT